MSETPEMFAPRPYQQEAIDKVLTRWDTGPENRVAVVLATGAGKTHILANLIKQALPQRHCRALVIAHTRKLVDQAAATIRAVNPDLTVGVVMADQDETDADVIVASVQTLAVERRRDALTGVGLVIVDEAHHAAAPTYMEVLEHFGAWQGLPTLGVTATMTRQGGGLGQVWQDVVYTMDILDLINTGYLCDVRGKRVVVEGLDLDAVKTANGDLQEGQLGEALEESGAAQVIADAYLEHAADRPGVIFTPTIASAQSMADVMTAAGIRTEAVWGAMPRDDQAATMKRYESGVTQVLANAQLLTEGWDAPHTSCAVIARPTKSPGLYVQMAGRALRLHPGKSDALILDVMGASTRHKLASIVDLTDKPMGEPREGQSLREAVAQAEEEAKRPKGLQLDGIAWQDVNLFSGSRIKWLRTKAGVWFIPAGSTYYFLLPDGTGQQFRVRKWGRDTRTVQDPPAQEDRPVALQYAMQRAEWYAERIAGGLAARGARWRAKPPTVAQLGLARRFGVQVQAHWTAGDLSDAVDAAQASGPIDQWITAAIAA